MKPLLLLVEGNANDVLLIQSMFNKFPKLCRMLPPSGGDNEPNFIQLCQCVDQFRRGRHSIGHSSFFIELAKIFNPTVNDQFLSLIHI